MAKYHLTDNGPKPCRAKTADSCRYKGAEHVEGAQKAIAAFEAKQQREGKTLPASASRNGIRARGAAAAKAAVEAAKRADSRPASWSEPMMIAPQSAEAKIASMEAIREASGYESDPQSEETLALIRTVAKGEIPDHIPATISAPQFRIADGWGSMSGYLTHSAMMENGYYGRITKTVAEDLKKNIGDGAVLDPMAGRGFAVKALREAGVPTVGTDDNSWNISSHLEKMDAMEALDKYGDKVTHVLMSWPDYESDIDQKMLAKMRSEHPHLTMIYVGEQGGCTGSEKFWDQANHVEPDHPVRYTTTHGLNDSIYFIK